MSAQAQANGNAQVSDWAVVKGGPPPKVLPALKRLCRTRNTGRRTDIDSVSSILRWMQAPPQAADAIEVQTCCLLLLGQWVTGELYRPLKQPSGESLVDLISQSADAALGVAAAISEQTSPKLAAATVYALGCASPGLAITKRAECCSATCSVLHASGAALLSSGLIADIIGGVGHLLTSMQDDMKGSLWALACLLSIWAQHGPTGGASASQQLDSMAPLYPALRRVATSLKEPAACLPAYVDLLQQGASSPDRQVASAATLAAGGALEGLHRNARAQLPHECASNLEHIISQSCRESASASDTPAPAFPGPHSQTDAQLLTVLSRDSATLACMECYQACRVPPASQETLLCMTRTLLNSTLGLEGLFEAAAAERDPSAANAWLQTHLDGCLMRSAAMLSRTVAEQYRSIAPACQQEVLELVQASSHRLYRSYEQYAQGAADAWLNRIDGGLVRQVMDKIFMSIVLLLSSFWDAAVPAAEQGAQGKSAGLKRADVAVAFLDTLAHVQFCRMRLSAYSVLLQSLLQATASSAEASMGLLSCLPEYDALLEEGPTGQAAWLSNSVLASRMQFLMGILAPCIFQLPQDVIEEQVCSPALLYLKHPHSPAVSSAHLLFCAALRHVCKKEELVPLYVKRSLEGYPGTTPLSGLAGGYEAIARHLPVGSPVLLFALQRLAQRAQRILRKPGGLLQPGLDLVSLLAHLMLLVNFNALEDGLLLLEEVVQGCDRHIALQACSCIVEILSASDDYTRKVRLVRWYMRLAYAVTS